MTQDNYKTTVIFRKEKDGEILALFPYDIWYSSDVMSYAHVGQHSGACYNGTIRETKPASREDYTDLLNELQQIGYNLEIKQKYNHSKFLQAYYKAANINH